MKVPGPTLFELMPNPAATFGSRPSIGVIQLDHGVTDSIQLFLVDTEQGSASSALLAYMWIGELEQIATDDEMPRFRRVMQSVARYPHGPLLYRSALAILTPRGVHLAPGDEVSEGAARIWERICCDGDTYGRWDFATDDETVDGLELSLTGVPGLDAMYVLRERLPGFAEAQARGAAWLNSLDARGRRHGLSTGKALVRAARELFVERFGQDDGTGFYR